MQKIEYPRITLFEIFKAYWEGGERSGKWMLLAFMGIAAGNTIGAIQPLFYKSFLIPSRLLILQAMHHFSSLSCFIFFFFSLQGGFLSEAVSIL